MDPVSVSTTMPEGNGNAESNKNNDGVSTNTKKRGYVEIIEHAHDDDDDNDNIQQEQNVLQDTTTSETGTEREMNYGSESYNNNQNQLRNDVHVSGTEYQYNPNENENSQLPALMPQSTTANNDTIALADKKETIAVQKINGVNDDDDIQVEDIIELISPEKISSSRPPSQLSANPSQTRYIPAMIHVPNEASLGDNPINDIVDQPQLQPSHATPFGTAQNQQVVQPQHTPTHNQQQAQQQQELIQQIQPNTPVNSMHNPAAFSQMASLSQYDQHQMPQHMQEHNQYHQQHTPLAHPAPLLHQGQPIPPQQLQTTDHTNGPMRQTQLTPTSFQSPSSSHQNLQYHQQQHHGYHYQQHQQQYQYHQQQPHMPNQSYPKEYFDNQEGHVPTWEIIVPPERLSYQKRSGSGIRKYNLSLLSNKDFTITAVQYHLNPYDVPSLEGLRIHIKKIARTYGNGQKAIFERVKNKDGIEQGRWRIPLSAYYAFITFLLSDKSVVVELIPDSQLKIASLGRAALERNYPSSEDLMKRGVPCKLAQALAPYQRGGVDFVLQKDGRALVADDMGLGKTVQSIASMACYVEEWPLLIFSPSSARYHWEAELLQWLGKDLEKKPEMNSHNDSDGESQKNKRFKQCNEWSLDKSQIHVLTSSKDEIFPRHDTKVVICSYGLATNLVQKNPNFVPGVFKCVIVDESHMLKSKTSKRTQTLLPLLKATKRVIMLSGTPALAKPMELYPQLSALLEHMWLSEEEYESKYCQPKGTESDEADTSNSNELAELHTMLTSTVMIRRIKADVLKCLPAKVRESVSIEIKDVQMKKELLSSMEKLSNSKGILGKLYRQHKMSAEEEETEKVNEDTGSNATPHGDTEDNDRKALLHNLYSMTGAAKIPILLETLEKWLSDPTNGKLCIFAHHRHVIEALVNYAKQSEHKYISITGTTLPKMRQEQIIRFQNDATVRIAILGITAAGVAVTLTAASTLWFAELYWTPAILIQAEDRCHRIGQQATVRCLYLIAKGTLDEVLWLLVKKKFRDLGEFVEGKEKMDIVVHRNHTDMMSAISRHDDGVELDPDEEVKDYEILEDLADIDDLQNDIEELAKEENLSKASFNGDDDDDVVLMASENKPAKKSEPQTPRVEVSVITNEATTIQKSNAGNAAVNLTGNSEKDAIICLSDDEEDESIPIVGEKETPITISMVMEEAKGKQAEELWRMQIPPSSLISPDVKLCRVRFDGPTYNLHVLFWSGKVIVREDRAGGDVCKGDILVAINREAVLHNAPYKETLMAMKRAIQSSSVELTFAEDKDFTPFWKEHILPAIATVKRAKVEAEREKQRIKRQRESQTNPPTGVIELLD